MKSSILEACNILLAAYEQSFYISQLPINVSTGQKFGQSNGLFIASRVKGMIEGKNYLTVDMGPHFIVVFIDRATENTDED